MTTIGQRLREVRERRMMTQEELGERAGVQSVTISRIENGRQASRPRMSTIRKLADALGEDARWVMFGEESEALKSAA